MRADDIAEILDICSAITPEQFKLLSPADQKYLLYHLEIFEKQRNVNPLAFFVPNGAQEEFIDAVGQSADSGKRIFLSFCANGVGKTAAAIQILGNLIYGSQSKWFGQPVYRRPWPHPKAFWYVSEVDSFKTKISSEFEKWFPAGKYDFTQAGRPYKSHLVANGWVGDFKTLDQDPKQFESADIGLLLFDEPPPQNIFNACVGRLRAGGIVIIVATPLVHSAWLFDDLVNNERKADVLWVQYADVEQNCSRHGVRGKLSHQDIEFIISQYDEEELEARAFGRPKHLSGQVYKTLHSGQHRPADYNPQEFSQDKYQIFCVMDIHDRRPPAIGWFAVGMDGKKFLIDEFPNHYDDIEGNVKQAYHKLATTKLDFNGIAAIIKWKEEKNGWVHPQKIMRVMDPNAGRRRVGAMGKTIQSIFIEAGQQLKWPLAFFVDVNDALLTGHAAVRTLLGLDIDGTPNLTFSRRCVNTWTQLSRYSHRRPTARKEAIDGLGDMVEKKYKDFPDVVRYFAMVASKPIREQLVTVEKPRPVDPLDRRLVMTNALGWRNPSRKNRRGKFPPLTLR